MTDTREMGTQVDEGGQINLVATDDWEFGDYPIIYTIGTGENKPATFVYPLHYVNVTVSGCDCIALEDSGCQIPVVSERLFAQCHDVTNSNVGQVVLHGFGKSHTVHAPLVKLTVCMQDNNHDEGVEIPLMCAVTEISVNGCDMI